MEACPNCGNYLIPRRHKDVATLTCIKCGFKVSHSEFIAKYKGKSKGAPSPSARLEQSSPAEIVTVDQQSAVVPAGSVVRKCPFCGYDKADLIYNAVTRGDEDMLELYKCAGCGKVSREGWGFA